MREYAKVSPTIWTSPGSRKLRGNLEALVVRDYLLTAPASTMLGAYYCPILYICNDTGLTVEGASKGLQCLIDGGFCVFDEGLEWVFVKNMARYQIAATLKEGDKRVIGLRKDVETLPEPIKSMFVAEYNQDFRLGYPDEYVEKAKGLARGLQGASMPHRSKEKEKEKEKDINTNKHISLNRVEDEAPAPVDVCDEFENPFFDEPPFDFEPDGQCFDAPFGQLIDESNLENNREVIKNQKHVLTTPQLVVLGKTWGVSIGHTPRVEDIANRGTLTVEMAEKVIKQYKAKNGSVSSGYLIECLDRASNDPDAYFGTAKKKEITPDSMTDAQCSMFAHALADCGWWRGKYRIPAMGKSYAEIEAYLRPKLRDPIFWVEKDCAATLKQIGLIKGA